MLSHKKRTYILCTLAVLSLIAIVVGAALGAETSVLACLSTAAGILVPAAVDALSVEKRRRNPKVSAIVDDITVKNDVEATD